MDALAARVRALVTELDAERERRLVAQAAEYELQQRVEALESAQAVRAMKEGSDAGERERLAAQVQEQEGELGVLRKRVEALEREKRSLEHRLRAQGSARGASAESALQQREAALERLARLNDELVAQVQAQAKEVAAIRAEATSAAQTAHSAGREAAARASRLEGEVERLRGELASREMRASEAASGLAAETSTARKRAAESAAERDEAVRLREEAEGAARVATQELRNALRRARQADEEVARWKDQASGLQERVDTLERRSQTLQQRVAQLAKRAERADAGQKRADELEKGLKHAEARLRVALDVQDRAEGTRVVALREALRKRSAELADAAEKEHVVLSHNRALAARCQYLEDTLDRAGVLLSRAMARCDALSAGTAGTEEARDSVAKSILDQQTHALRAAVASLHALQTKSAPTSAPADPHTTPATPDKPDKPDPLHGQLRLLRDQLTSLEVAVGKGVRDAVLHGEQLAEARAETAQWRSEAVALRRALARLQHLPPPTSPHADHADNDEGGEEKLSGEDVE